MGKLAEIKTKPTASSVAGFIDLLMVLAGEAIL
jgi:hypothetical protein